MNFLLTIAIIYLPINNDNRVTLTQQKDIYFFTITLQAHNKQYNFMRWILFDVDQFSIISYL